MKAYNLVLRRLFKASVSVTLYECPWHPYIESTDSLIGFSSDRLKFSFLLYPMIGKGLTRLFVSQAMRQKYRTSEERTMRTIRKNPSFYGDIKL